MCSGNAGGAEAADQSRKHNAEVVVVQALGIADGSMGCASVKHWVRRRDMGPEGGHTECRSTGHKSVIMVNGS